MARHGTRVRSPCTATASPACADGWARLDGAGRHADGRRRDRGDGGLDALGPQRQPRRRVRRPRERTDELVDERPRRGRDAARRRRRRASSSARRMTALTMRFAGGRRPRRCSPATRSSARAWTTTPTSRPWVIAAERAGATVRFAEPDRETLELPADRGRGRAVASARAGSRSPPPPTRSAPMPDLPGIVAAAHARRRARLRRRRPRRAAPPRSTSPRSAATRSPARPTSGSARTSGSCGRAPSCSPSCSPTSCAPRPTRCPTAGSSGRCRSSRSPACAPRPTTCSSSTARRCARTRTRCWRRRARRPRRDRRRDALRRRARPRADADVHRRRPHLDRGRRARWPSAEIAVWHGNYYAWELERCLGLEPARRGPRRLRALQRRATTSSACSRRSPSSRPRRPARPVRAGSRRRRARASAAAEHATKLTGVSAPASAATDDERDAGQRPRRPRVGAAVA